MRQEVLRNLQLGDDAAEHEGQLRDYFLRTAAYHAVVRDEADLIIGAKGTGKTAIARILTDPNFSEDLIADVLIVPVFNIRSSGLYASLLAASQTWAGGHDEPSRVLCTLGVL